MNQTCSYEVNHNITLIWSKKKKVQECVTISFLINQIKNYGQNCFISFLFIKRTNYFTDAVYVYR